MTASKHSSRLLQSSFKHDERQHPLVPGDCAERYLAFKNTQGAQISVADIDVERVRLGLDKPYMVRWGNWIVNAFRGDFGDSCILRVNINQLLGQKFWLSLGICLSALLLAYIIAIPVGIISATSRNPLVNNSLRFVSYLGLAMPNFLLALMIMLFSTIVFGDTLTGLFSKEFRDAPWSYDRAIDFISRAWLPIFILGWSATAFAIQTVRALMSDEVGKLYQRPPDLTQGDSHERRDLIQWHQGKGGFDGSKDYAQRQVRRRASPGSGAVPGWESGATDVGDCPGSGWG